MDNERTTLAFLLLEYVPNVLDGAAMNIGIILLGTDGEQRQVVGVRFISDWARVAKLDPAADVPLLKNLASEITQTCCGSVENSENLLRTIESFSSTIQVSERLPYVSKDPKTAMEELARKYL